MNALLKLLACALIVFTSSASAQCIEATLADYIALGNSACTTGPFTLSGFNYSASPNAPTASEVVLFSPDAPVGPVLAVQFLTPAHGPILDIAANDSASFTVLYSVSAEEFFIRQFSSAFGASFSNAFGGGSMSIHQETCVGGIFSSDSCTGALWLEDRSLAAASFCVDAGPCFFSGSLFAGGPGSGPTGSGPYWDDPYSTASVSTTYRLNSGPSGSASLSALSIIYSTLPASPPPPPPQPIPEPAAYALFLTGLAALGAVARRRKRVQLWPSEIDAASVLRSRRLFT